MEEKTDLTVPEPSEEQQLPVEVAVEGKPSQALAASPSSNSSTNANSDEVESNLSDNLVRFISICGI